MTDTALKSPSINTEPSRDIWVSSDMHLFHQNILKFTDSKSGGLVRGHLFSTVSEMNSYILYKHNSRVKPGDIHYNLGDVFIGDQDNFKRLWPKFHGSKRLIVGNHDNIKFLSSGGFFSKVQMWRMFPEYGLMFSHVPIHKSGLQRNYVNRKEMNLFQYLVKKFEVRKDTLYNCHGHIHQNKSPRGPYMNLSMEAIDYTPIHIEDLAQAAAQYKKSRW
jgi:calcineurin-like phosphoesterase family protein